MSSLKVKHINSLDITLPHFIRFFKIHKPFPTYQILQFIMYRSSSLEFMLFIYFALYFFSIEWLVCVDKL